MQHDFKTYDVIYCLHFFVYILTKQFDLIFLLKVVDSNRKIFVSSINIQILNNHKLTLQINVVFFCKT